MENPIKMDDLGVPLFLETSIDRLANHIHIPTLYMVLYLTVTVHIWQRTKTWEHQTPFG